MQAAAKEQVTPASPQPPGRSAGGASPGGPILAVALALAFVLAGPVASVAGEARPGLTGGAPVLARAHDADEEQDRQVGPAGPRQGHITGSGISGTTGPATGPERRESPAGPARRRLPAG